MGMFDELVYKCPICLEDIYVQLKIRTRPMLDRWTEGSAVPVNEIYPDEQKFIVAGACECEAPMLIDLTSGKVVITEWHGVGDEYPINEEPLLQWGTIKEDEDKVEAQCPFCLGVIHLVKEHIPDWGMGWFACPYCGVTSIEPELEGDE